VDERTRSAGEAEDACPSCDSPGAWSPSRRHRFNPFAGVISLVLSFWALVIGYPLGLGFAPAAVLAVLGLAIVASTRTALECQVCGFVKPRA
jgi:hypothetical protein